MVRGIDIDNTFAYHKATASTGPVHDLIREVCREAAHELDRLTPPSAEQTLAIRSLQEAMFWANAAVAIHGAPEIAPVIVKTDAGEPNSDE